MLQNQKWILQIVMKYYTLAHQCDYLSVAKRWYIFFYNCNKLFLLRLSDNLLKEKNIIINYFK